jgi:Na+/phosphate symporter
MGMRAKWLLLVSLVVSVIVLGNISFAQWTPPATATIAFPIPTCIDAGSLRGALNSLGLITLIFGIILIALEILIAVLAQGTQSPLLYAFQGALANRAPIGIWLIISYFFVLYNIGAGITASGGCASICFGRLIYEGPFLFRLIGVPILSLFGVSPTTC